MRASKIYGIKSIVEASALKLNCFRYKAWNSGSAVGKFQLKSRANWSKVVSLAIWSNKPRTTHNSRKKSHNETYTHNLLFLEAVLKMSSHILEILRHATNLTIFLHKYRSSSLLRVLLPSCLFYIYWACNRCNSNCLLVSHVAFNLKAREAVSLHSNSHQIRILSWWCEGESLSASFHEKLLKFVDIAPR